MIDTRQVRRACFRCTLKVVHACHWFGVRAKFHLSKQSSKPSFNLPEEVIEYILLCILGRDGTKDLSSVARTCKKLHRIATPILWADIHVRMDDCDRFNDLIPRNSRCLQRIRNFTIETDYLTERGSTKWSRRSLLARISQMKGLQTLSVQSYRPYPEEKIDLKSISEDAVSHLIDSIPSTIISLNLDIVLQTPVHHGIGLNCTALCKKLTSLRNRKQLQNLRLHHWLCCAKFFRKNAPAFPALKSLIIHSANQNTLELYGDHSMVRSMMDHSLFAQLARQARQAYLDGMFPSIEKFILAGPHVPFRPPSLYPDMFPAICHINIIHNRTTIIPFKRVSPEFWWTRFPRQVFGGYSFIHTMDCLRVFELLEYETWVKTTEGLMVVSSAKNRRMLRQRQHVFEDSAWTCFEGLDKVDLQWDVLMQLLVWDERISGRKLLLPKIVKDVVYLHYLCREARDYA